MVRLQIQNMSTPTGEDVGLECPYCGKNIAFVAKLLDDNDTVILDYDGPNLHKGDRVKV